MKETDSYSVRPIGFIRSGIERSKAPRQGFEGAPNGLVTIFWDGNFSGARGLFDQDGNMKDREAHEKRMDKFLGELIWMSKVLLYGRENVTL